MNTSPFSIPYLRKKVAENCRRNSFVNPPHSCCSVTALGRRKDRGYGPKLNRIDEVKSNDELCVPLLDQYVTYRIVSN